MPSDAAGLRALVLDRQRDQVIDDRAIDHGAAARAEHVLAVAARLGLSAADPLAAVAEIEAWQQRRAAAVQRLTAVRGLEQRRAIVLGDTTLAELELRTAAAESHAQRLGGGAMAAHGG